MPDLFPVDYNPFPTPTLTPVEHDPWAGGNEALRQINLPDVGAAPVNLGPQDWQPIGQAGDAARAAIGNIASIPQRAIEGSAADLATMGSGAPMQSVGPATDAAMMMMGGASPFAEEGALGAAGGKLTKSQIKAVQDYSGGHAIAANTLLREGEDAFNQKYAYMGKSYPAQVQKTIDNLDKMASPLESNAVLYRGMPISPDVKAGDVLSDPGFQSTAKTSGTPQSIAQQNGGRLVEIHAPQGTNAIDLGSHGMERGEVVLPRNTQLHVTDVRPDRVVAEVRPSAASNPVPLPSDNAPDFADRSSWQGQNRMPIKTADGKQVGSVDYSAYPDESAVRMKYPQVYVADQGKGLASAAYQKIADWGLAQGKQIWSDRAVTTQAQQLYDSLKNKGYTIADNPSGFQQLGDSRISNDGKPLYKIVAGPPKFVPIDHNPFAENQ